MEKNVNQSQVAEATAVVNHVEGPVRRRKQKSKFEKALQGTRNLWGRQVDKSVETLRRVLATVIASFGVEYTREQFKQEFYVRLFRLLDSKRFGADCAKFGLNPYNAATHIVLDGLQKTYRVLDFGIDKEYGTRFNEMKEPVIERSELESCDSLKVLSGYGTTDENKTLATGSEKSGNDFRSDKEVAVEPNSVNDQE